MATSKVPVPNVKTLPAQRGAFSRFGTWLAGEKGKTFGRSFGLFGGMVKRSLVGTSRVNYNMNLKTGKKFQIGNKTRVQILREVLAYPNFNNANREKFFKLFKKVRWGPEKVLTLREFITYLNGGNKRNALAQTKIRNALKGALLNKKAREKAGANKNNQNRLKTLGNLHSNNGLNKNERNAILQEINSHNPGLFAMNKYSELKPTSLKHFILLLNKTAVIPRNISANAIDDMVLAALKKNLVARNNTETKLKNNANAKKRAMEQRLSRFKPKVMASPGFPTSEVASLVSDAVGNAKEAVGNASRANTAVVNNPTPGNVKKAINATAAATGAVVAAQNATTAAQNGNVSEVLQNMYKARTKAEVAERNAPPTVVRAPGMGNNRALGTGNNRALGTESFANQIQARLGPSVKVGGFGGGLGGGLGIGR